MMRQNFFWKGWFYFSVFLLNLGLARVYGAAESGNIFFTINNLQLVILFVSLSLQSGLLYYGSSANQNKIALSIISITWAIIATIIASVILYFFYPFELIDDKQKVLFTHMVPYLLGVMSTGYFTSLFISDGDYKTINLIPAIVNIGLLALLPIEGNPFAVSIDIYANLFFLGFLVQGILLAMIYFIRNKKNASLFDEKNVIRKIFRYSMIALVGNLAYYLLYRIDYLFVAYYCDPLQLGNYIQVSKIGQLIILIPSTIAAVIVPQVIKGEPILEQVETLGKLMLLVIFAGCLIILVAGNSIFTFILGPTFNQMKAPFLLLLPGIYFLTQVVLISAYFGGKGKLMIPIISNIFAIACMVTGDFLLIPVMGIEGAALVCTVSYLANLAVMFYYYHRETSVSIKSFFVPVKQDYYKMRKLIFDL